MTDDKRIRERAYAIWEEAGRPEGEHDAHWDRAAQEIAAEAPRPAGAQARATPNAKRAKERGAEDSSPTPAAPDGGSTPAEVVAAAKPAKSGAKGGSKKAKGTGNTDAPTLAAPDGGASPAEAAASTRATKSVAKGKGKKA